MRAVFDEIHGAAKGLLAKLREAAASTRLPTRLAKNPERIRLADFFGNGWQARSRLRIAIGGAGR